ncbi:MAG: energy-coupling factor transporter transmembrane protein EcfT [Lachnospiraceae bacterium]|nr:energy-coupling factor transporter transmembrane protein EcfT [Lachnospiraceae bacterium]
MLKDITIGRYYQTNSILHRLDPRTKLFGTVLFLITVFISDTLPGFVLATVFLLSMMIASGVPMMCYIKGIKGILPLMLITMTFTLLFTGGDLVFNVWIIKISKEGISQSVIVFIRFLYLITGSSILTLTTKTNDLTDGLERAFAPLNKIKVPVHDIAMMMGIAMRFIPILTEEADKIMKAQMARGADFNEGGLVKKAKGLIPLIVPLIVSAINRALELATAMETRCYRGGEGRTKMKPLKYSGRDYAAYSICLVYILVSVTIKLAYVL